MSVDDAERDMLCGSVADRVAKTTGGTRGYEVCRLHGGKHTHDEDAEHAGNGDRRRDSADEGARVPRRIVALVGVGSRLVSERSVDRCVGR